MRTLLLITLLVIALIVVDAQLPKLTLKQQKVLKRRGEKCLNKFLPKTPQAAQIKSHLQTCFEESCGNQVIHKVQAVYPALVPQLRSCLTG